MKTTNQQYLNLERIIMNQENQENQENTMSSYVRIFENFLQNAEMLNLAGQLLSTDEGRIVRHQLYQKHGDLAKTLLGKSERFSNGLEGFNECIDHLESKGG